MLSSNHERLGSQIVLLCRHLPIPSVGVIDRFSNHCRWLIVDFKVAVVVGVFVEGVRRWSACSDLLHTTSPVVVVAARSEPIPLLLLPVSRPLSPCFLVGKPPHSVVLLLFPIFKQGQVRVVEQLFW